MGHYEDTKCENNREKERKKKKRKQVKVTKYFF